MTETAPRYRTCRFPGPGLATIREPDGRVALWSLNRRGSHPWPCVQCGVIAGRNYRPANPYGRGQGTQRLCRPCVEDVPEQRGDGIGL